MKKFFRKFWDLLFPRFCLGCGKSGIFLCEKCFKNLNKLKKKLPIFRENSGFSWIQKDLRKKCKISFLVLHHYQLPLVKKLVKQLKYKFSEEISDYLGSLMAKYLEKYWESREKISDQNLNISATKNDKRRKQVRTSKRRFVIVPVPISPKRLKFRGYNQALLLAESLKKNLVEGDFIKILNCLKRKEAPAQATLNRQERLKNLDGKIFLDSKVVGGRGVSKKTKLNLKNKTVILVDDVATTCSTLKECSKVLIANGCREIWWFVVAHD